MKIADISPETEHQYFCCLEEWSDDIREAGDHKQKWYERMRDRGVRVKFALDDNGVIGGMIQYLPIEQSIFNGRDLYTILCIWVHGHKQGRGDYRHRGMGTALLKAAEDDCKNMGARGMAAWGLGIPVWMKASWFKGKGYKVVDRDGINRLLWKPFTEDAVPPRFIKPRKLPGKGGNAVNVTIFRNGWCPVMNLTSERAVRAARVFGDKINVTEYDTLDKQVVEEWGITDGLFIDGREINIGPPPTYEKIRKTMEKRVKRLK
jgi:GNAT superfamily N-acetyltransferase